MSGQGTEVDTLPQVNSMIRMYMFYVYIWGSHWGSHWCSHVSLGFLWGHKRAQESKTGFGSIT